MMAIDIEQRHFVTNSPTIWMYLGELQITLNNATDIKAFYEIYLTNNNVIRRSFFDEDSSRLQLLSR